MPLRFPFRPIRPVEVFAVAPDAVQVTWRRQRPGPVELRLGDRLVTGDDQHGVGVLEMGGLRADTHHEMELHVGGRRWRLAARTLPRPAGRRLARIATLSDLHVGEVGFGLVLRREESPEPAVRHPRRCALAAARAAVAWGAELLVIKGDLTHHGHAEEWAELDLLLAEIPIPVLLMAGNHDDGRRAVDADAELARRGQPRPPVRVHDQGGLRILLVDTARRGLGHGMVDDDTAGLAAEHAAAWDGPVLVCTHHHPQRLPFTWFWPPGLPKATADRFLTALAAVTDRVLVTTGHTHRHRLHDHAVPVSEVGSPKDFPGVWAGYDVHEDGIVQVVRRVADPACVVWTESTRRAAAGLWGRWSPGTLDQRCFTLPLGAPGAAGEATSAAHALGRTS